jgi:hypothetical protein
MAPSHTDWAHCRACLEGNRERHPTEQAVVHMESNPAQHNMVAESTRVAVVVAMPECSYLVQVA